MSQEWNLNHQNKETLLSLDDQSTKDNFMHLKGSKVTYKAKPKTVSKKKRKVMKYGRVKKQNQISDSDEDLEMTPERRRHRKMANKICATIAQSQNQTKVRVANDTF